MSGQDLNLLTALDALLQAGSVAGAARRLGLSASAMSRTLTRLRTATGDPLLVRAGRGLVPTPHAIALRSQVPDLAAAVHAVLRPVAGFDLARVQRVFAVRANEGFVEEFGPSLVAAVAAAPGLRLRFVPKADKDVRALREGLVDLDLGVLGETGPELRVQAVLRDCFVGVVRLRHALAAGDVTPDRYAACGHVVVSRRGHAQGPVDTALAALGLARPIVVLVASFPAALAIARASDLVALVPERQTRTARTGLHTFTLPIPTPLVTVAQMWHPRLDADPAHRWLREQVLTVCRSGEALQPAPLPPDRSAQP